MPSGSGAGHPGRAAHRRERVLQRVRGDGSRSATGVPPAWPAPTSRCSVETYSSPSDLARSAAALTTASARARQPGAATVAPRRRRQPVERPLGLARNAPRDRRRPPRSAAGARRRSGSSSASSRCSGSTCGWPPAAARHARRAERLLATGGESVGVHHSSLLVRQVMQSSQRYRRSAPRRRRGRGRSARGRGGRTGAPAARAAPLRGASPRVRHAARQAGLQRLDLALQLEDALDAGEVDALVLASRCTSRSSAMSRAE